MKIKDALRLADNSRCSMCGKIVKNGKGDRVIKNEQGGHYAVKADDEGEEMPVGFKATRIGENCSLKLSYWKNETQIKNR